MDMKKKIRLSCITMMLLTFMILTGCGGASKESADYYAAPAEEAVAYEYDNDLYLTESAVTEEAMEEAEAETGGVDVKETTRKLIKTVDLEAETENFDALLKTVNEKTEKLPVPSAPAQDVNKNPEIIPVPSEPVIDKNETLIAFNADESCFKTIDKLKFNEKTQKLFSIF